LDWMAQRKRSTSFTPFAMTISTSETTLRWTDRLPVDVGRLRISCGRLRDVAQGGGE
jgi:hypothetical protein